MAFSARAARLFSVAALLVTTPFATFAADVPAAQPKPQNTMTIMSDLSELYKTPAAWDAGYTAIKAEAEELDSYKGTLGTSAAVMLKALDAQSHVNKEAARLYTYASLKADEDLSQAKNQERRQQAGALMTLI